ncbi:apoptosis regulator BAX-like isoform 1-T1 [Synchiropus picturatus]
MRTGVKMSAPPLKSRNWASDHRIDFRDSIMQKAAILLTNFIFEKVQQCVKEQTSERVRDLLQVQGACDPHLQEIALCLRKIGDEMDGHPDVQRLQQKILQLTKDSFMSIAYEVFSDGIFNWGRVVTLFLFASAIVLRAVARKSFDLIQEIVGWTLEVIKKRVLGWIRRQGGWEACLSYVNKSNWQTPMLLVGVALLVIFVIHKWRGSGTNVDK